MTGRPTARALRRPEPTVLLVAGLAAATFLQWLGASAVLPLLPLYLQGIGEPDVLIGAVMAAYFVGAVAAQYLAGRTGDRFGHRRVLVVGLVGYAVASTAFLLPWGGPGYLLLRAGQGAFAGSAEVAVLALVARSVRREARGRAFSAVYGAQLGGIAVGPLLGTAVGVDGMGTLFALAGSLALVACLPVLTTRRAVGPVAAVDDPDVGGPDVGGPDAQDPAAPRSARAVLTLRGVRGRILVGVLLAAVVEGAVTGVYEAVWSLLLDLRGATPFQVGLSWTLFALPYAFMIPLSGWMADRYDRRLLVAAGLLSGSVFAALYPFLPGPAWLVGLGALESVGVALAIPAAQSLVADAAAAGAAGRAQGLFASVTTGSTAVAAAAGGALFGVGPWVPFVAAAAIGFAVVAALPFVWRHVPGRVAARPAPGRPLVTTGVGS